ncbi:MerR family transcriptional regulator [Streptomyces roseicoloratus]|uniref:MerR family transcriptional regulator n=1 Tax=Streptomyces roseicoloratus TaxID=2508722 RepID=A0ABY9RV80_9ACTN|nr:MerR family transcriptional regulator [Streptomyces roseicoloratus]WMX45649.1 MerR family transcriptional regulator [Streptomyces roseicoloratus]
MAWSIADVARMSGVTSRTLRHYDEIGLLPPAWTASSGHRHYEEPQLLRLQQILLMRELDVGLREIQAVLDSEADRVTVLREHHARLVEERDRLGTLAATVARTIADLESPRDRENESEDEDMVRINRPENLFEGFRHDPDMEAEVRERWPAAYEESRRAVEGMTPETTEEWQREATAQMIRFAEHMAAGTPVDAPEVQEEVDAHYRTVCRFWTPTAEAYKGLAATYAEDPRFRENFDRIAVGLADYQGAAMAAYADARLS